MLAFCALKVNVPNWFSLKKKSSFVLFSLWSQHFYLVYIIIMLFNEMSILFSKE
jgi:hypothetical protein